MKTAVEPEGVCTKCLRIEPLLENGTVDQHLSYREGWGTSWYPGLTLDVCPGSHRSPRNEGEGSR